MPSIKSTGLPVVVLLFVSAVLGGCMGTGSEGTAEPASGPANASTAVTEDQPATDSVASDLITPATSGCNHVVFCDQPSSSNGTVCHQDGCSLGAAETECLGDLQSLGCSLRAGVTGSRSTGVARSPSPAASAPSPRRAPRDLRANPANCAACPIGSTPAGVAAQRGIAYGSSRTASEGLVSEIYGVTSAEGGRQFL